MTNVIITSISSVNITCIRYLNIYNESDSDIPNIVYLPTDTNSIYLDKLLSSREVVMDGRGEGIEGQRMGNVGIMKEQLRRK